MSTALRPLLRSPVPPLAGRASHPTPTLTITPFQQRNATIIRRPQRPYTFEQLVILSDGSSYKQLTTSPQGVFRSSKDVRNHFLWNPLSESLANVEEDEAGRLKKFREKFGTGFDATKALAERAGDAEAVASMRESWATGGGMHEADVEAWKGKIDEAEVKEEVKVEEVKTDNLFGLISGSFKVAAKTEHGRRARRAKRNAKGGPADESGEGKK
ncbi:hypothetical protein Dda_3576 [Drechslerella dactyloides]|uniref:Ribosomal protein bL31m N-terminal domain-containing protein n=1 Tax=Drechslerella dactyloides TaxID=74499 RepID=A0AAD6IY78_DREDA|nr:hypothetical protein Dda_3576 [Drechslerella dactyloides]